MTEHAAEGLWFGGLLPYVLRPSTEVDTRQIVAGLAAGGLGATGMAVLSWRLVEPSNERLAKAALGAPYINMHGQGVTNVVTGSVLGAALKKSLAPPRAAQ